MIGIAVLGESDILWDRYEMFDSEDMFELHREYQIEQKHAPSDQAFEQWLASAFEGWFR